MMSIKNSIILMIQNVLASENFFLQSVLFVFVFVLFVCFFLLKVCPFRRQGICIYIGNSQLANSLKQQSTYRLIRTQYPDSVTNNEEAANANFIIFGLTRPELGPSMYHSRDEHSNHTTYAVVLDILDYN